MMDDRNIKVAEEYEIEIPIENSYYDPEHDLYECMQNSTSTGYFFLQAHASHSRVFVGALPFSGS